MTARYVNIPRTGQFQKTNDLLFFMSVILHNLTDFSTLDWYGWQGGRSPESLLAPGSAYCRDAMRTGSVCGVKIIT